jgi:stage III sporulation protein AH
MINKSKLWFLTLSSIILVLAIYYIVIPNDNDALVFNNVSNSSSDASSTTIEESEILTAMRVQKEEDELESTKLLQEILLSSTNTIDEKNEAYEQIKNLNTIKANEEKIEKEINENFKINCFVQIKDNTIKIVLANVDESNSLANDIIAFVNSKMDNKYYCTVTFE